MPKIRKRFYITPILLGVLFVASFKGYYMYLDHKMQAEQDRVDAELNALPPVEITIENGVVVVRER